ncbi:hypothetical protein [Deinococcus frigens]|uniref:hypothetical protein n=1 Tax=Deinococcus frigens TaxID=249403 RepID=UPI00054EE734|nr:hypothetical protein [Deinococcus frigens]
MSLTDLLISLALMALVVRQLRGRPLTTLGLLWPLALVGWAAAESLHTLPPPGAGMDFAVLGLGTGLLLGVLCGALTRLNRRPDGVVIAQATALAAALWIVGVGSRLAPAFFAQHGGGPALARFSAAHHLSAAAWTAALLFMALAEVLRRTAVLAWHGRAVRLSAA